MKKIGGACSKGRTESAPSPVGIGLKFIYSEKATKFREIFPLHLIAVHTVKSKGKISQKPSQNI